MNDFDLRLEDVSRSCQPLRYIRRWMTDYNDIPYQLRARSHTLALINKTKFLNDADFIIRLLYKHAYWFL